MDLDKYKTTGMFQRGMLKGRVDSMEEARRASYPNNTTIYIGPEGMIAFKNGVEVARSDISQEKKEE